MSNEFQLNAELRSDEGKGASRRLRRLQNKIPAVIYGGKEPAQSISLLANELNKALQNEAFYSHILTLTLEGKEQQAILRDLQRHPAKPIILHADFLRVDAAHALHMNVPLHFINEDTCIGVKLQGGAISHQMSDVEIKCLPKDLPEYIEVDMAEVELDNTLHLSDIKLPEGVEIIALTHGADHDLPIANVHTVRAVVEEEPTEAPAEGEDAQEGAASDDTKSGDSE